MTPAPSMLSLSFALRFTATELERYPNLIHVLCFFAVFLLFLSLIGSLDGRYSIFIISLFNIFYAISSHAHHAVIWLSPSTYSPPASSYTESPERQRNGRRIPKIPPIVGISFFYLSINGVSRLDCLFVFGYHVFIRIMSEFRKGSSCIC